jgi:tetratricopeptide (TPR) repeat protein
VTFCGGVRCSGGRSFAARETGILALWNSPRHSEAYAWFTTELANLRTAFRWAAEHDDLDTAAPIATFATLLGVMMENFEPVAWAEELLPRARAADHSRLTSLYVMATHCWPLGRIEDSVRYGDEAQELVIQGRHGVPRGLEGWLGGTYTHAGQPGRTIEMSRELLARDDDRFGLTRSGLVAALIRNGCVEEAKATARELIEAAEVKANPWGYSYALLTYGMAWCDADPVRGRDALQRGLAIARNGGVRYNESHLASVLGRLEAQHGDALAALEHFTLAIRNYHDSGNTTLIRVPLASLAACLDRLACAEAPPSSRASLSVRLPEHGSLRRQARLRICGLFLGIRDMPS